jgi:hypothetical protein
VKTADGWHYYPAVMSANGCVKFDYVSLNDREEKHLGRAYYYIDWPRVSGLKGLSGFGIGSKSYG